VTDPLLPRRVTIVEVGPRDGLQNEAAILPAATKVAFIEALADAGLPVVEMTAFVSPKWVPQMADAVDVARAVTRREGTRYLALVPNRTGLTRAIDAGLREVAIFAAASETFSRRNINQGIDESLAAYADVANEARRNSLRVRGYLSTAFGCPYEGAVAVDRVVDVAARLLDIGCDEVAVSDTIGVARPRQVVDVVEAVALRVPRRQVALHFHDTRGTALANVYAALECGIAIFDSSAGGLGGESLRARRGGQSFYRGPRVSARRPGRRNRRGHRRRGQGVKSHRHPHRPPLAVTLLPGSARNVLRTIYGAVVSAFRRRGSVRLHATR
jgi:hydroxymethylglutaryl-CoA lyase